MSELDFHGRVAVITGAGRGIGRSYAHLLAERGAQVVVNDLGGPMGGGGADAGPASEVVAEIVDAGGSAVADANDIASVTGSEALIAGAIDRFGRLDVVVNNAGIMRWAGLPTLDAADMESHLAVHTVGSFNTTRAAWSHMVDRGYGRVVMTTSAGMLGLPNNTAYATAKGGVIGLTRSLASAGAPAGIKVNAVAPAAFTRMAGRGDPPPEMDPALVAPLVAYLCHESCPVSGEIYTAGAGRFARMFIATTDGYLQTGSAPTIEDVVDHWEAINDRTGYSVPADLMDWSARFLSHLDSGPP